MTVTEFWMLHAIAKFSGHVKSRQQLMHESKMVVDDTTITSHIKRIRKKFLQVDPDALTVWKLYMVWGIDGKVCKHGLHYQTGYLVR